MTTTSRAIGVTRCHRSRRTTEPSGGALLDHAETEIYSRTESNGFWNAGGHLSERLGPDATGLDAIELYMSEQSFVDGAARRLRQELLTEVEAAGADRADNQSLRCLLAAEDYDGELFGDLPRNGYRSVVRALANGLDIRLGTEVTSVEVGAGGIRVTCADGSTETGSHAIVTVPLGVLKRGGLRFDPPLPAPVQRAVDALGFGRYEKIALRFESAFWRDFELSHLIVFPSARPSPRCGCSTSLPSAPDPCSAQTFSTRSRRTRSTVRLQRPSTG